MKTKLINDGYTAQEFVADRIATFLSNNYQNASDLFSYLDKKEISLIKKELSKQYYKTLEENKLDGLPL